MNNQDIRIYRIIGNIVAAVKSARGFTEAVQGGLREITGSGLADHGILWYRENEKYRPFYWICPADLSGVTGEYRDDVICSPEAAEALSRGGLDIADSCSVPVEIGERADWVLELLLLKDKAAANGNAGSFSSDDKDTFGIFGTILGLSVTEYQEPADRREQKVLYRVEDLHKSFLQGDVVNEVLKGVNLTIYEGEFLCFLGESGCGKSTLLNILDGLLPAESGQVLYDGRNILKADQRELTEYRRQNIGFIFQSYNLMPNLNVLGNLRMVAELVPSPLDCMETLRMVGLEEKAGSYPSRLSGGQQQRVSIARALVKNPRVIIADEPTAALDYATSIEVLRIFEDIRRAGTTILMVTHNTEIARMADRVVRLSDGRVSEVTVQLHPAAAEELKW